MNVLPRAACCSSNLPHVYSEATWLESWAGHQIFLALFCFILFVLIQSIVHWNVQISYYKLVEIVVPCLIFSVHGTLCLRIKTRLFFLRRLFNLQLSLHVVASNEQTKSTLQISSLIKKIISRLHEI